MKQTESKKILSLLLVLMLCAAIALSGCSDTHSSIPAPSESPKPSRNVLGEGSTVFLFTVVDAEGKETNYEVHTDKTVVGEALSELGLIEGEMGQYGLYVRKVAGMELDFDRDGKYWAFYVNDEYAMSGVDTTEIKAGETYSFKAQA